MQIDTLQSQLDHLISKEAWREAIETLASVPEEQREAWMDIQLRDLRIKAFKHLSASSTKPSSPCPPLCEDPFSGLTGKIPEVDIRALNLQTLAGGIRHHGALIVKNFFPKKEAEILAKELEKVFAIDLSEEEVKENQTAWYSRPSVPGYDEELTRYAKFMQKNGGLWTLFSPKITQKLISIFNQKGLKGLITDYFNAPPHLSINKWVLRRLNPLAQPADWHQDGSFMNADIKSLNLWIALSPCGAGTSSPAMDFIPKRLNEIVPTGSHGAKFKWSISHEYVAEHFPDFQVERPYFDAGDAIFFDHFNLHATSYSPHFTDRRYAIETWFFAQDSYPENQYPIIW